MAPDGDGFRRVVASPLPKRIFQIRPVKWLLEKGCIVICAGGGGIPTMYAPGRRLQGIDAVVDKDRASCLMARELEVDLFIMATDADAVYLDWGQPTQRAIRRASPEALAAYAFAAGSMGPKVEAAIEFAERTGKTAAIGALADVTRIARGEAGTIVTREAGEVEFYPPALIRSLSREAPDQDRPEGRDGAASRRGDRSPGSSRRRLRRPDRGVGGLGVGSLGNLGHGGHCSARHASEDVDQSR